MDSLDILNEALTNGVYVYVEDGKLKYKAPSGAMTARLRSLLVDNKDAIIEHLASLETTDRSRDSLLPDIQRFPREGELPLSYSQQRLWFIDKLNEGSVEYNLPSAFTVDGAFNSENFVRAINAVLTRHEVLRTQFKERNGTPFQRIRQHVNLDIERYDLSQLVEVEQDRKLKQLISDDAQVPFRLDKDLLLRVAWIYLASDRHVILFNMHHIVSDGWSLGILIRELSAFYSAYQRGNSEDHVLPELAIQYYDYAYWQREWLKGRLLSDQVEYWKNRLEGAPTLHGLPCSFPRPQRQDFAAGSYVDYSSVELTAQVNDLCKSYDVTPFMLLETALAVLLYRYSAEEDIVIGTPVAGRVHPDVEPLIGLFVNILVLRTNLEGNPTFIDLLQDSKKNIMEAYDNQYVSFDMLVEELKPTRTLSHSPIFQIMMVMQQKGNQELDLGDLQLRLLEKSNIKTPYDLELGVLEEDRLRFSWKYSTSLFSSTFIEALSSNLMMLLESIVHEPVTPIDDLPMLHRSERDQLSVWSQGSTIDAPAGSVVPLILEHAANHGQQTAVVCGSQSITYSELNQQSSALARLLLDQGIGQDSTVGLHLDRSVDMIVAIVAVLRIGAAYVPLDPDHPMQRTEFMLKDSGTGLMLASTKYSHKLRVGSATVVYVDSDMTQTMLDKHVDQGGTSPDSTIEPGSLAYLIYTSGSTGTPKGVMVEHSQLLNFHRAMNQLMGYADSQGTWLAVTNYSFDISILELVCTLAAGMSVVVATESNVHSLASQNEHDDSYDGSESLADLIRTHHVSHFQATPSLITMFSENEEFLQAISKLDVLLVGGEALPTPLADTLRATGCSSIYNMYGPTETTIWSTSYRIDGQSDVSIGRPLGNTQVYILSAFGNTVPIGAVGELYIGGHGVTRGYKNRSDLQARHFVNHPNISESTLYRTGDKVRWRADGQLDFLGRVDHQVKIRGHRIELGEIESALSESPIVTRAIVIYRPVAATSVLVAYVTLDSGRIPDAQEHQTLSSNLKSELSMSLPSYMVPDLIIVLSEFPLTTSGKVNRFALPEPDDSHRSFTSYVAPRNDMETQLCVLWQDILELERIGIEDNFFELGGHSLLSTQLISKIRQQMDIEVGISELFQHPTIAEFSVAVLEQQMRAKLPPIARLADRESFPLSYAQQRLWVIDQLDGQSAQYNMPYGFTLKGGIDAHIIEMTINVIIERHEALRTRFVEENGEVFQHVDSNFDFQLKTQDLTHMAENDAWQEVKRISIKDERTPFVLSSDLMLRAMLLVLPNDQHVLLFNMHHIVSDGWSMKVLVMEFYRIYTALLNGKQNPLAPLPLQYGDFSSWQRSWLQGERLTEQLDYWKKTLKGVPKVHSIPLDRPRPAQQSFKGDSVRRFVELDQLLQIKALCQRTGVTLFMFVQTVFAVLLARYGSSGDIVMSTVVAGRDHKDIESIIGFFLNTIVLRTQVDNRQSFIELLKENKQNVIGAFSHQHVSFDTIVEEVNPPRSSRYNPLFQVMISLLDDKNEGMELSQSDLNLEIIKRKKNTAKFELVLNLVETPKGLKLSLAYNSDMFYKTTAENMLDQYASLLSSIVDNPHCEVGLLDSIGPTNADRLSGYARPVLKNDPDSASQEVRFIENCLSRSKSTDAPASNDRVTYLHEVTQHIDAISTLLNRDYSEKNSVALIVEPSYIASITVLACLKLDISVTVLSPRQDISAIAYVLRSCEAKVVVCDTQSASEEVVSLITASTDSLLSTDSLQASLQSEHALEAQGGDRQHTAVPITYYAQTLDCQLARVFATQEIVQMRVREIAAINDQSACGMTLYLTQASCYVDTTGVLARTLSGQRVEFLELADFVKSPRLPVEASDSAIEIVCSASSLNRLLQASDALNSGQVSRITLEGHRPSQEVLSEYLTAYPSLPLFVSYTNPCSAQQLLMVAVACDDQEVDIYRPAVYAYDVLDEHGRITPLDCLGEICIRSPLEQNDDKNAYTRTGIRGRYRSGSGDLEIAGVQQRAIQSSEGVIDPLRIAAMFSSIESAVNVEVILNSRADAEEVLECYVQSSNHTAESVDRMQALADTIAQEVFDSTGLATQAYIVSHFTFDTDGTLDLVSLQEAVLQPSLKAGMSENLQKVQQELLEEWHKLLGDKPISVSDNFFTVGGHSLLMIALLKNITKRFGVDIPLKVFIESSTVEDTALLIDSTIQQRSALDEPSSGTGEELIL